MFKEFIGKQVKCCYRDDKQFKIARGELVEENKGLLKITGKMGTIIIRDTQIEKLGLLSERKE